MHPDFCLTLFGVKFARVIFSFFCILLLIVPMAEKLQHELSHLDDQHCSIKARHYCQAEEQCPVCDYLSGHSAIESLKTDLLIFTRYCTCGPYSVQVTPALSSAVHSALLRGPPAC